jgi:antitoxin HicB
MVRLIIEKEETMKTLNDYMALPYRLEIVEDQEEGRFIVSYPDLTGCITCEIQ